MATAATQIDLPAHPRPLPWHGTAYAAAERFQPSTQVISSEWRASDVFIKRVDSELILVVADRSEVISSIAALKELPLNWDGYRGVAVSAETADQATAFAASLPAKMINPDVVASGDGSVNLIWRSPAAYLEIVFDGSATYSAFGQRLDGDDHRLTADMPSRPNRLTTELRDFMSQFDDGRV